MNTQTNKLQAVVKSYNNTHHRTIGIAPKSVTCKNETAIWCRMYWPKDHQRRKRQKKIRKPFRLKIVYRVRLAHLRYPFFREYDERWMGEIFNISQRVLRGGLPVYRVKDFDDDKIKGIFYQSEL